mmetsp:Transcript_20019/g.47707  ORF Transcript_20019/g.47707 Transcript_20019/m.47707 type:complete len:240 (-) Transcript_20019:519-1238(-)
MRGSPAVSELLELLVRTCELGLNACIGWVRRRRYLQRIHRLLVLAQRTQRRPFPEEGFDVVGLELQGVVCVLDDLLRQVELEVAGGGVVETREARRLPLLPRHRGVDVEVAEGLLVEGYALRETAGFEMCVSEALDMLRGRRALVQGHRRLDLRHKRQAVAIHAHVGGFGSSIGSSVDVGHAVTCPLDHVLDPPGLFQPRAVRVELRQFEVVSDHVLCLIVECSCHKRIPEHCHRAPGR